MSEGKSQQQRVREHLLSGKSITPIEALNRYGCFRLSAIILELRNAPYDMRIRTDREDNTNNSGQHARYVYEGPRETLFDVGEPERPQYVDD